MEHELSFHFHCKLILGDSIIKDKCCADITFNRYHTDKIEIKLFVENGPAISAMLDKMVKENSISKYLKILDISEDRVDNIWFDNSTILSSSTSTRVNYITIGISEFKYSWHRFPDDENSVLNHAFFLNSVGRKLSPIIRTSFDARGKWEEKTPRAFLNLEKLDFCFTNEFFKTSKIRKDSNTLSIEYTSLLDIYLKEESEETQIFEYAELICLLASFYFNEKLDFYKSIICKSDKFIIGVKILYDVKSQPSNYSYTTQYNNFKDFIDSIESINNIINNFKWWKRNIEKLITSVSLDGESEFMVLFNIVEQSLTYLRKIGRVQMSQNSVYFKGIALNLKLIKELCRKLVLEIREFIPTEESEELDAFDKQNNKIAFNKDIIINKSNLTTENKIQLILEKLEINLDKIGIHSIRELINLRDDIIHSNREIPTDEIEKVNRKLFKLANLVLLRLMNKRNELSRHLLRN